MSKEKKGIKTQVKAESKDGLLYYSKCDKIDATAIGKRFSEVRHRLNLTAEAFGNAIFVTEAGIRKYESGNSIPNGRTIILLHEIFGVDIQWLLFGTSSNRTRVLSAINSLSEADRFDILMRLYSYYATKDMSALNPYNNSLKEVSSFAKKEQEDGCCLYRPIKEGEEPDEEDKVEYSSLSLDAMTPKALKQKISEMDPEIKAAIMSLLENPHS